MTRCAVKWEGDCLAKWCSETWMWNFYHQCRSASPFSVCFLTGSYSPFLGNMAAKVSAQQPIVQFKKPRTQSARKRTPLFLAVCWVVTHHAHFSSLPLSLSGLRPGIALFNIDRNRPPPIIPFVCCSEGGGYRTKSWASYRCGSQTLRSELNKCYRGRHPLVSFEPTDFRIKLGAILKSIANP